MTPANKLSDTDMCVKCGLCLPHCPTYNKTQDENESPRGRISLIQGWAAGALEAGPKMLLHLDNCLLCRACERVCPAVVPYGRLMDDFRTQVGEKRRSGFTVSALKRMVKSSRSIRMTRSALMKYQRSGAQGVVRKLGLEKFLGLGPMGHLLPDLDKAPGERPESCPAQGIARGRVG
ncbi:MAG: 4Fe-4S dicluster domain-containing protein, partial [Pseudomonadota bacterium]